MQLVIAEKPSVANSIADVLGANERKDGYREGNGYYVSWCVGHLVELEQPQAYGEQYENGIMIHYRLCLMNGNMKSKRM